MTDITEAAIELASLNWPVFPLLGKSPFGRCGQCVRREPDGRKTALHPTGECPHDTWSRNCHGLLGATTDIAQVGHWWSYVYPGANIGMRVPASMFAIDLDPWAGGLEALEKLQADHGPLPDTLGVYSGRNDGGQHRFYLHPGGSLVSTRIRKMYGKGIDLKTHSGYTVAPPSLHPATKQPYRWDAAPLATPPEWLISLLRPEVRPPVARPARTHSRPFTGPQGPSIADWYSDNHTWAEVLAGWSLVGGDGEGEGSTWRHPTASSASSATIRFGMLFNYSDNSGLPKTEAGYPVGLTKFRCYAELHHNGDLSAAARALRQPSEPFADLVTSW